MIKATLAEIKESTLKQCNCENTAELKKYLAKHYPNKKYDLRKKQDWMSVRIKHSGIIAMYVRADKNPRPVSNEIKPRPQSLTDRVRERYQGYSIRRDILTA